MIDNSMKHKHAFLMMAHREPELVESICHQLSSPNHFLYIHIDKKCKLEPFKRLLQDIPHCYVLSDLERIEVNWGGVFTNCRRTNLVEDGI